MLKELILCLRESSNASDNTSEKANDRIINVVATYLRHINGCKRVPGSKIAIVHRFGSELWMNRIKEVITPILNREDQVLLLIANSMMIALSYVAKKLPVGKPLLIISENRVAHNKREFGAIVIPTEHDCTVAPINQKTQLAAIVNDRKVIAVDDVLITGKTVRRIASKFAQLQNFPPINTKDALFVNIVRSHIKSI